MEEARKQAGLSGAELARRVGVSAPTMSEWRRGRVEELRAGDLLRLCENLDVRR
jgi:transcriptional regulator with XRE-family HTH domain